MIIGRAEVSMASWRLRGIIRIADGTWKTLAFWIGLPYEFRALLCAFEFLVERSVVLAMTRSRRVGYATAART